jgi:alpha-beta hydrolase superfamily lysophospholipase
MVESILSLGLNLCIFDFAGYGNSEGETVSLGCREIWDIECIIQHLREHYNQYQFILWGRSMGAVAALLYLSTKAMLAASKEKVEGMSPELRVVGGIYDSPFYSL